MPSIPHPDYLDMRTRKVKDPAEHILLLVNKLTEEYSEFGEASTPDEQIKEACDVLEVLHTLELLGTRNRGSVNIGNVITYYNWFLMECLGKGLNLTDIQKQQKDKTEKKGGFIDGIVWINKSS